MYPTAQPGSTATAYFPECRIHDKPEMPIRSVHLEYPNTYLDVKQAGETYTIREKCQYEASKFFPRSGNTLSPLEAYVKLLSRMKINMIIMESPIFYCLDAESGHAGYDTNLDIIEPFFDYCKKMARGTGAGDAEFWLGWTCLTVHPGGGGNLLGGRLDWFDQSRSPHTPDA